MARVSTLLIDMLFMFLFVSIANMNDKVAKIIFITTSNEFASESYEVRAEDYLIKPYDKTRLENVMDRIFSEKKYGKILELKDGRKIIINSIVYTTFSGHYVTIFMSDGEQIQTRSTQKDFEKMMESFKEKFKIAKVLASIFTHSSTLEENESYHKWINENPEHQKIADRILNQRTYEEHSLLIKSFSSQKAWEKIYPLLNGEKAPNLFLWKRSMRYAALILLLMIPVSYPIYKWISEEPISEINPGTHGGEVTLSNGTTFKIPEGALPEGTSKMFIIDSKGINYQMPTNKPQIKEIKNTLQTLHGMECHITLSDGTKVHLNAESQLIYPVCFSNEQRIVQIKGEAYFDVAPDSEHPFIVQTPYTSIQVTGTTFNVRAYPDENIESTTLINGSIKIKSKNEDFELTPNQHFIFDKNSKRNTVTNVNTELYTSWESGSFIFKNIPLESVMSYLSKWYGFKYTFEDDAVKQVKIGAYLNRYANMNPIIDMIKELNLVDIKQREGVLHISYK